MGENQIDEAKWARDAKMREEADKVISTLTAYLNRNGSIVFLTESMQRQHRTLQQMSFAAMMWMIKEWASLPETHYDLRNEFTVKTCKKIMQEVEWCGAPLI